MRASSLAVVYALDEVVSECHSVAGYESHIAWHRSRAHFERDCCHLPHAPLLVCVRACVRVCVCVCVCVEDKLLPGRGGAGFKCVFAVRALLAACLT
jgi:hypothetical protein